MLKDEVREILRFIENGYNMYQLREIEEPYTAFVIRKDNWRGVGIPIDNEETIESNFFFKFENIKICIDKIKQNDQEMYLLELLTNNKNIYDQFALICLNFIEPGENGKNRESLNNNPNEWTNKWKDLLGNKLENDMNYSYLGELIVLKYLLKNQIYAHLTKQGTFDIESQDELFEVKTTVMRYASEIEVHSQYQLSSSDGRNIKLYFVRLEESLEGYSFNSVYNELKMMEYDEIDEIDKRLEEFSSETRNKKYNILEVREYLIDDNFPKIVSNTFKEGKMPDNIINIKYVIDLDGLSYKKIEVE